MKTYEGLNVCIHVFFIYAQVGGEWSALRLVRFIAGERASGTH
jgi:hypothetical protein